MCRVQPSLSPCYPPRNLTTMTPLSPTKSPSNPPPHQVPYSRGSRKWVAFRKTAHISIILLPPIYPNIYPRPSIPPLNLPSITPHHLPSITPHHLPSITSWNLPSITPLNLPSITPPIYQVVTTLSRTLFKGI